MNVSCPDCRSIFRVDPAKVPPAGVRARCSVCSGVITIPAPTGQNTPAGGAGATRAAAPGAEQTSQDRPRQTPASQGGWDSPPFSGSSQRGPAAPPAQRPAPPPPPSPQRSAETPAAPRPRQESAQGSPVTATVTPPSPASGLSEFGTPPAPPFTARPAAPYIPSAASTGSAPSAPPFVPSAPAVRPAAAPPRPPSTPPSTLPVAGAGSRRPLNPFLSKDPNQRAKRLARALVSDIITYHPAKHAEGLRDGTLKQLFREEIKKSFEEYIAQVGQQLAESTTYFQEALNEVLGAGKKIF
ncbi:MAG: zinc-ribbon domain-containing protein [Gemmatimonadales bacterium]